MNNEKKLLNIAYILMAAALVSSCDEKKQTSQEFPDWAWAAFQRPAGVNPVISPDTTTFLLSDATGFSSVGSK